jgi:hypothetical protein
MFRGTNLQRYFSRVGSKKLTLAGASSSSGNTTSIACGDGGDLLAPVIDLSSTSQESVIVPIRTFAESDPRYLHAPRQAPKRSFETPHSVCNQPRKRRRSNPAVALITPERLGVPRPVGILDLTQPHDNGPIIDLSSGSAPCSDVAIEEHDVAIEQDEMDIDVLQWIEANRDKSKKVSYEATRKFQATWAIKLPWAECVKGQDGLYDFVKCIICRYQYPKPY